MRSVAAAGAAAAASVPTDAGRWPQPHTEMAPASAIAIRFRMTLPPSRRATDGDLRRTDSQPRHAVLIRVLAIVLADVLDYLVARHAAIRERGGPRLLEHFGIFDRDL